MIVLYMIAFAIGFLFWLSWSHVDGDSLQLDLVLVYDFTI